MKRKIGKLNNKPVIIGDKNLITSHEIHIDDFSNIGGGEVKEYFYTVNPEAEDFDANEFCKNFTQIGFFSCLVTVENDIVEVYGVNNILLDVNNCLPFVRLYDIDYTYFSLVDNHPKNIYKCGKGDAFQRVRNIFSSMGATEDIIEELVQTYKMIFKEITKEEYESHITYKQ